MKSNPKPKPVMPEAFYDHFMAILVAIGTDEYELSRVDAQSLAHEVIVASYGYSDRIANMRSWLTATMRAVAQFHLELHGGR